eukprot:15455512-Alexandrium_andersonii.AAC.1
MKRASEATTKRPAPCAGQGHKPCSRREMLHRPAHDLACALCAPGSIAWLTTLAQGRGRVH